jgi:NAD-dependent SIR2 family protein deacetylase
MIVSRGAAGRVQVNLRKCWRGSTQKPPQEIIESFWEVEPKVDQLAGLLGKAKYPIFFTGAGISTSIGIPDYRSSSDTVVKTGPGLWNRKDTAKDQARKPHETPIDKLVDLAQPSLTHMFIKTMLSRGIARYLVSQNTDGLHLRSGVPLDMISELHGNRNMEHCLGCKRRYSRDFRTLRRDGKVYKPGEKRDHFTGRHC